MREIKFRYTVVRKNGHVFHEDFTIESLELDSSSNGWLTVNNVDIKNELHRRQFTGLHDKNENEVYEGDILSMADFMFPITVNSFHGYRFKWGADILTRANAKYGEVIGNIYENPELLEA